LNHAIWRSFQNRNGGDHNNGIEGYFCGERDLKGDDENVDIDHVV